MKHPILFWTGFHILIFFFLYLDLFLFRKKIKMDTLKSSLCWSSVWIATAFIFNFVIWILLGSEKALSFFTGYVVEKSLSIDNLFVFLLIFTYFQIPVFLQQKVLFWGIVGALISRFSLIFLGIALLESFSFMYIVFGAFLCFTAFKFALQKKTEYNPQNNFLSKICQKIFPFSGTSKSQNFFILKNQKLSITPLFLCLVTIEATDVVFALDSIPAVLSITKDPFIAYTSNVFAVLGLKRLYFVIFHLKNKFSYLKYGIMVILFFIGTKMIVSPYWKISTQMSLSVVVIVLVISVIFSFKAKNT